MSRETYLLIGLVVLFIAFIWSRYEPEDMVSIDGFTYKVGQNQPMEAAETLHRMNGTAIRLIALMRRRIEQHENGSRSLTTQRYLKLKQLYENLRLRYNPDRLQETLFDPLNPSLTSYVHKKGEVISMCVRHGGKKEPVSVLLIVLLHELTHIASNSRQHPPEFWEDYSFILKLVAEEGWAKNLEIPKEPVLYCGKVSIDPSEMRKLKYYTHGLK